MGLDVPDLDDRTYDELLEDARKRIPVHAEEWTDHNAHDPGITILELLAWLAESHAFQLDRVTDAHRRKYLGLVDVEPRPPQQASVELALAPKQLPVDDAEDGGPGGATNEPESTGHPDEAGAVDPASPDATNLDGTEVGTGTPIVAETPAGRRERFRTTDAVTFSATAVAAVVVERDGGRTDHTRANEGEGLHFLAFGEDPDPGDALYLGFDGDPFASPTLDLWIDFHDADLPEPASHGDEVSEFEPSLRCVWEHCERPDDWYHDDAWAAVEPDRDETNALYSGGRVTLPRPSGWSGTEAEVAGHPEPRHWLRCRLASLPGEDAPEPRYEVPPRLNAVEANVVRATHETTSEAEALTTPAGRDETTAEPNQRFEFEAAPVQSAEVAVGGESWTVAADFSRASPDDAVAVLDRAAGTVTFGDGRRGKIPAPGLPVEADYVAGGGPAGNLPPDATWTFDASATDLGAFDLEARAPPVGGRDAESVEAALARARERRRVPFRAVTAEDHATIATSTPGLRFGRAAVAAAPGDGEPTTVVVVPYSPDGRLPVPSEGFRRAVETHLCDHALLTERVRVVAPTYVPVDVRAEVEPVAGADREATRRDAAAEIEAFLDPLDGFEGDGWPFGRPVYRSELYERLENMDRVADAVDVGVSTRGDLAPAERGDTLPRLAGLDVTLAETGTDCGRDA